MLGAWRHGGNNPALIDESDAIKRHKQLKLLVAQKGFEPPAPSLRILRSAYPAVSLPAP